LQPLPEATRLFTFATPELDSLFRLAAALADVPPAPRFVEILVEDDASPRLVTSFAGLLEEVEEGGRRTAATAEGLGIEPDSQSVADGGLHGRLQAFALGRDSAVVLRAGVRRDAVHRWLVEALAESHSVARAVCAHAHAGVGVARVRLDGSDPERLPGLVASLRGAAVRAGGSLVVEVAPAAWKPALDVWGPPGPGFPLMKGVKAAFDPRGLLAPGRFVGGL
jgi:glycolate oxidase FAD binding subunit